MVSQRSRIFDTTVAPLKGGKIRQFEETRALLAANDACSRINFRGPNSPHKAQLLLFPNTGVTHSVSGQYARVYSTNDAITTMGRGIRSHTWLAYKEHWGSHERATRHNRIERESERGGVLI